MQPHDIVMGPFFYEIASCLVYIVANASDLAKSLEAAHVGAHLQQSVTCQDCQPACLAVSGSTMHVACAVALDE